MLFKIMQAFGTPNDKNYVGLSKLPEFKLAFPKFKGMEMGQMVPEMAKDPGALDIVGKMLQLNPGLRPEAKELVQHPWFDDIRHMKS
jgi:serine/threonine protein kinase